MVREIMRYIDANKESQFFIFGLNLDQYQEFLSQKDSILFITKTLIGDFKYTIGTNREANMFELRIERDLSKEYMDKKARKLNRKLGLVKLINNISNEADDYTLNELRELIDKSFEFQLMLNRKLEERINKNR